MITLLLIRKIASLFVILLSGFLLVRFRLLKSEDTRSLSGIMLYLLTPCTILNAFEVDCTPEIRSGLLLAFIAGVLMHLTLLLLTIPLKRLLRLDALERASVIYSNAGNLIIPLVSAIMGGEWIIYTSGFMVVQLILIWSHGKSSLCGVKGFDLKKILGNINLICVLIGFILFFTGLRFPFILQDSVESLGGMIGPVAMLITGMLIGGMPVKKLFSYRRLWLVTALRLIGIPLIMLALLKLTGLAGMAENGKEVLLIAYLACMTPSASTITGMAVVYGQDGDYAASINIMSTLLCIVTMPLMVSLFMKVI